MCYYSRILRMILHIIKKNYNLNPIYFIKVFITLYIFLTKYIVSDYMIHLKFCFFVLQMYFFYTCTYYKDQIWLNRVINTKYVKCNVILLLGRLLMGCLLPREIFRSVFWTCTEDATELISACLQQMSTHANTYIAFGVNPALLLSTVY